MKEQILGYLIETILYHDSPECVSIGMIVNRFEITRYRAKKIINELLSEGMIIKAISPGGFDEYTDQPYPPLKGYAPSFATKESEVFEKISAKVDRMYKEWAEAF